MISLRIKAVAGRWPVALKDTAKKSSCQVIYWLNVGLFLSLNQLAQQ